jgi:hypothetical protein
MRDRRTGIKHSISRSDYIRKCPLFLEVNFVGFTARIVCSLAAVVSRSAMRCQYCVRHEGFPSGFGSPDIKLISFENPVRTSQETLHLRYKAQPVNTI